MVLHSITSHYMHACVLQAITSNYIVTTRYYMHVMDIINCMGQHHDVITWASTIMIIGVITRHYMHVMACN